LFAEANNNTSATIFKTCIHLKNEARAIVSRTDKSGRAIADNGFGAELENIRFQGQKWFVQGQGPKYVSYGQA
jgi:hypothetical protein